MSQSPAVESELEAATDPNSLFRKRLKDVNRLMNGNGTLSGHERNCVFLNTGKKRFATVSAVTGFDFDDDTRSVATVDWDGDGDLDVWTTNRTSPRVRFLRNDQMSANHFVSVRLVGTKSNRDAIGAKVEVKVDGLPAAQRLAKTLRAGEGFLTQNSKWLHFGLGSLDRIREIVVQWPSGSRETFPSVAADRRYRLVEGSGRSLEVAARTVAAPTATRPALASTGTARIPLTQKIPIPALRYQGTTGETVTVSPTQPSLLVLWSSQCGACREELQTLVAHQTNIEKLNLQVIAICIDSLLDDSQAGSQPTTPKAFLESIQFPFAHGMFAHGIASLELIKRLQAVGDLPFAVPVDMATPTSFLVYHHELASIYRGNLPINALTQDVAKLTSGDADWTQYAYPFSGRWHEEPDEGLQLLQIPRQLVERGHLNDAIEYVRRNKTTLATEAEFAKLMVWIGDQLIAKRRTRDALTHYQWALETNPDDLAVMNNVAWQFATHPDQQVRDPKQAVRWAERAAKQTKMSNAGVLDTLAASYAADNQFGKATQAIQRAIQIVQQQGQQQLVKKFAARLALYKSGRPYVSKQ